MLITARHLNFSFAKTKREVFERVFPRGAEVTVANARRATAAGLSLRCAAQQLLRGEQLAWFNRRAIGLLVLYYQATNGTLQMLRLINPYREKLAWMDAESAHESAKRTAWEPYLDGLAKVFVEAMQEEV